MGVGATDLAGRLAASLGGAGPVDSHFERNFQGILGLKSF
jgi:hypothetical protein